MWSDLKQALDGFSKPSLRFDEMVAEIGDVDLIDMTAPSRAARRALHKDAHAAIEIGLKAILHDLGLSQARIQRRGHRLHDLLELVEQHNPEAFAGIERSFNSVIQFLQSVTSVRYSTDILHYFRQHGTAEVYQSLRYESIEHRTTTGGMVGYIYMEVIQALMAIVMGKEPQDLYTRIESEAAQAVRESSHLEPAWDAETWLRGGYLQFRLLLGDTQEHKVLRAALRKCARASKDKAVRDWAGRIRRAHIASMKLGASRV